MNIEKYKSGFSFVGVLVSTFIATVALVGILSLVVMAFKAAFASEKRLIASGLAQEGIEIVRSIRRGYDFDWRCWYDSDLDGEYCVQYNVDYLFSCSEALKFNNGKYQYDSGDTSPFTRTVTLEKISQDEVKVVSEVKWQIKGSTKGSSVIAEDHLWQWRFEPGPAPGPCP